MNDKKFIILITVVVIFSLVSVINLFYLLSNKSLFNQANDSNIPINSFTYANKSQNLSELNNNALNIKPSRISCGEQGNLLTKLNKETLLDLQEKLGGLDIAEKYLACEATKAEYDVSYCLPLKEVDDSQYKICISIALTNYLAYNHCNQESVNRCREKNPLGAENCDKLCQIFSKNSSVCDAEKQNISVLGANRYFYDSCSAIAKGDEKYCDSISDVNIKEQCRDDFFKIKYLSSKDNSILEKMSETGKSEALVIYSVLENKGASCENFYINKMELDCLNGTFEQNK